MWSQWGNSSPIKSCYSGTLLIFNYALLINWKWWKESSAQRRRAKLLKQNSEAFQANRFGVGSCWLSKQEAFHLLILFTISMKSFEPFFFNLTNQQHLIPTLISDVVCNACWYKALWKAISVFLFAYFLLLFLIIKQIWTFWHLPEMSENASRKAYFEASSAWGRSVSHADVGSAPYIVGWRS